ncbi:hypothetical protein GCM10023264_25050 [Sphingomonas daechungensis]
MVSGEIQMPAAPAIGDVIAFDLQGADLVRHKAAFAMGPIKVTDRIIHTGATVMLDDLKAKTKEDALQMMAFFEDCHGLFGDRWDEQVRLAEAEE